MPTKFQSKVYEICRKIPEGKVTTYKAIAEAMGTKAYRAVGQALNRNPYAPRVPCHRVVNSKGHLHGFAPKFSHGRLNHRRSQTRQVRPGFPNLSLRIIRVASSAECDFGLVDLIEFQELICLFGGTAKQDN